MKKKYLIIFTIMLGIQLQALDLPEIQEDTHVSISNAPEVPLTKKLSASEMLIALQKTTNDQTRSILLVSDTLPESVLNKELRKLGLSKDLIIGLKEIKKKKSFWISEFVSIILSGAVSTVAGAATGCALDKENISTFLAIGGTLFSWIITYNIIERNLTPFFRNNNRPRGYLKQIRKINFNDRSISILKVPNKFMGIIVKSLEKQGFELI